MQIYEIISYLLHYQSYSFFLPILHILVVLCYGTELKQVIQNEVYVNTYQN